MKYRRVIAPVFSVVTGLIMSAHASGQERVFAQESFAYRGTFPLELQHVGNDHPGWLGPWRSWNSFPAVFVDTHTINNPFGSGHANSNRASNASGTPRASVRKLAQRLGVAGTKTTIEFAMMERFGSNQDGEYGGIQLLFENQPVVFAGRAPATESFFAIGKRWDAKSNEWQRASLRCCNDGELYRTHFFRITIDARNTSKTHEDGAKPTVALECYDMYGLPVAKPVSMTLDDVTFDEIAIVLDDYQIDELVVRNESEVDRSPIHYRPALPGRLADTIPFYWNGQYHIFYLRAVGKVPWEHIVSNDMIHWRELPTALISDGSPESPDGQNMFTGSLIEREGTFHLFYTGWNPRNPSGREFVMHATSTDLLTWNKQPKGILGPDGVQYSDRQERDFRDPFVWFENSTHRYMMALCTGSETGIASSENLVNWTFEKPLQSKYERLGTPECPDVFEIDGNHYLIVSPTETQSTVARYAKDWSGPYRDCDGFAIDTPVLYAAKRLFDGQRHIVTGWIRDLENETDSGAFLWGGTQSVPRELYVGRDAKNLQCRPIPEAVAQYPDVRSSLKSVLTALSDSRGESSGRMYRCEGDWKFEPQGASVRSIRSPQGSAHGSAIKAVDGEMPRLMLDTPENYLLEAKFTPSTGSTIALTFRAQEESGRGYTLLMRQGYAELYGGHFKSGRAIELPLGEEVTVQAFVQGSIIECFINNAYAFSCRAYDLRRGGFQFAVVDGAVTVHEVQVRTASGVSN